jgi:hypothetical protein
MAKTSALPAIAIEQRNSVKSTRSTVGTMTEVRDYMKLLWPPDRPTPLPPMRRFGPQGFAAADVGKFYLERNRVPFKIITFYGKTFRNNFVGRR